MSNRAEVLDALRTAGGAWVSGQKLGALLGISRASVSKHVKALQAAGYEIESLTRRGYRLVASPDRLSAAELAALIRTRVLGRADVRIYDSIGSTNDEAKRSAADGAVHGSLFVAETQTAGRGRRGRHWISPPGCGIYASVVLRPELALSEAALLTIAAALATAESVRRETDLPVTIKWPNDVLINGCKTAGLLCEMSSEIEAIEYAVIGVGINVNTPAEVLPRDRLIYPATSIQTETEHLHSRAEILANWLRSLEHWTDELVEHGGAALIAEWERSAGAVGKIVRVGGDRGVIEGEVLGLRDDGALRLRTASGEERVVLSGDVLA